MMLSHSGSCGTGASVAAHYSQPAQEEHPELPTELKHLAWLDLDQQSGNEYWNAMNLMGEYAAIAKNMGASVLIDIENHHNFRDGCLTGFGGTYRPF